MKRTLCLSLLIALLMIAGASAQNHAPVMEPLTDTTILEGTDLAVSIIAADEDIDDTLSLWVEPAPDNPVFGGNAAFVDNGDGTGQFTFSPDYSQFGVYDLDFYASDGQESASRHMVVTVVDTNLPPALNPIGAQQVIEGATLAITISAFDPDGFVPSLRVYDPPEGAQFADSGNGKAGFVFTPSFVQSGEYDVLFEAFDGVLTDSEMVHITVTEAGNQPPILTPIGPQTAVEGVTLETAISATDPDGTIPLLELTEPWPTNSDFTVYGDGTGLFTFTPDISQVGDITVFFNASDDSITVFEEVVISVLGPNQPPAINSISNKTVIEGGTLQFNIIATDPNTEGEATATYLVRMLRDIPGLTVTRIASGLPMGGDLEFADELTLGRALAGRRAMA